MEVEVVIEVPQGSRNKYEMDPVSGRIRLDRMLFASTRYPATTGSSRARWPRTATRWQDRAAAEDVISETWARAQTR